MPIPYTCGFCYSHKAEHTCRVVLKAKIFEMKSAGDRLLVDLTEVCTMHHEDIGFSVGANEWEKVNRRK